MQNNVSALAKAGITQSSFCSIFLHQSCERSREFMFYNCGHLSAILFRSRVENENESPESFVKFLRGKRTEHYFPASFLKVAVLNDEN